MSMTICKRGSALIQKKSDCLKELLHLYLKTNYPHGVNRLTPSGRKLDECVELVARRTETLMLQVLIPQEHILVLLTDDTEYLQLTDTVQHAIAVSLDYTSQSRLDGDFHNNVFQHLEPSTEEEAQHSTEITDVHERCAAFPIQRSDNHKNSPLCMYNPMDETSSANKIYVQRRNGSKTSIIESDSGLVKNGSLLQLLKMARTCVFIFHEGQIG